jgi:hypothetical protein
MKTRAIVATVLMAVLAAACWAESPQLDRLLPAVEVTADVMELGAPPRMQELTQRIREAAARNPEWFEEHVAKATPGEPLPYDPRLGVSEAEYREYLQLIKTALTMVKVKETRLRFRQQAEGVYTVEAAGMPDLAGITIELKKDRVRTPFGVLGPGTTIENRDDNGPTGPWTGTQWALEQQSSENSATVAKLAVGRLSRDGRGILYYTAREIAGGKLVRRADAIIFYALVPSSP